MPRLTTRLRYGLARMLLKSQAFSIVPPWVTTSILNPAYRSLVRDGYQKSSSFFACISALAFAFPEPPLRVYDGDGDDAQALDTHGLRKLLRRPMPNMGEAELMATTMVYLAIGGNAYWHKLRGAAGQVVQLRPYGAGHITPIPGGKDWIKGYTYDPYGNGAQSQIPGSQDNTILPEDIVHFKWPAVDPLQPWMSQPPILAAATEVDSDVEAIRFLFALLKNDAIPRTVVTVPADRALDDDEFRRTKEQWKERYGGENRGDVAILEGGATATRLGLNLQELAFDALAKIPESRIAAAMRVPPIIAGLNVGLDRSTYSNYGEARRAFTQDTLVPLWRLIASEVEADLLPEFPRERGVAARYDTGKVASLQEERVGKWKSINDTYKSGLLKKNEGRRALGYPDVPDGDTFYSIPAKPAPAALPDAQAPKTVLMLADGTLIELPYGTARLTKATADRGDLERRIEKAAKSYLKRQYTLAADAIRDLAKADAPLDEEIVEQLGLDMGGSIQRIMRRYHTEAIRQAFHDASAALDVDLAWNVENKAVQAVLGELAELVTRISDETKDEIRRLVGQQAREGWSLDRLAKEITKLGEVQSITRARTIARTETATAYNLGSIVGYDESGVVIGVDVLDGTNDAICTAANGQRWSLKQARANPIGHPNCRRTFAPVID